MRYHVPADDPKQRIPGPTDKLYILSLQTMAPDDRIPPVYTRLARLSTWFLLTGLIFLPTAHIHPPTRPSSSPARTLPSSDLSPAQYIKATPSLTFPIMVLPPLCIFLGTIGILILAILRRSNNHWLSTNLLFPSLTGSLAALALVFYLVYKDGLATWMLMETVTAIIAGAYSAVHIAASVVVGRRCKREVEERDREAALEAGRGAAPQIPEVERVTSLKDELLPNSSSREVS